MSSRRVQTGPSADTLCSVPVQSQVEQMAKQMGVADNVSYTCETAAHFWLLHVLAPWEKFMAAVQARRTPDCVKVRGMPRATLSIACMRAVQRWQFKGGQLGINA